MKFSEWEHHELSGGDHQFRSVVTEIPGLEGSPLSAALITVDGTQENHSATVIPWDIAADSSLPVLRHRGLLTPTRVGLIKRSRPPIPWPLPPPRNLDWLPTAAALEDRVRALIRENGEDAAREILAAVGETLTEIDYFVPIEHTASFQRTCKHLIEGAADWLRRAPAEAESRGVKAPPPAPET